jgi:hypothetical protein
MNSSIRMLPISDPADGRCGTFSGSQVNLLQLP